MDARGGRIQSTLADWAVQREVFGEAVQVMSFANGWSPFEGRSLLVCAARAAWNNNQRQLSFDALRRVWYEWPRSEYRGCWIGLFGKSCVAGGPPLADEEENSLNKEAQRIVASLTVLANNGQLSVADDILIDLFSSIMVANNYPLEVASVYRVRRELVADKVEQHQDRQERLAYWSALWLWREDPQRGLSALHALSPAQQQSALLLRSLTDKQRLMRGGLAMT